MSEHLRSALAVLATLFLCACAGAQPGGSADRINGIVTSLVDGQERPTSEAKVTLSILGNEDLVGVATTNFAGTFFIDRLSNRVTYEEAPLLRKQEYQVEIVSAEHYIMKQRFTFGHGTEDWTFTLDSKTSTIDNDDLLQPPSGEGNGLTFGGSVRKGR